MGQMTAGQVLAQVDDLLPNSYPGDSDSSLSSTWQSYSVPVF